MIDRYAIDPVAEERVVNGGYCLASDVAALEAKHAALLEVAGKMAEALEDANGTLIELQEDVYQEYSDMAHKSIEMTDSAIAAYREVVECRA